MQERGGVDGHRIVIARKPGGLPIPSLPNRQFCFAFSVWGKDSDMSRMWAEVSHLTDFSASFRVLYDSGKPLPGYSVGLKIMIIQSYSHVKQIKGKNENSRRSEPGGAVRLDSSGRFGGVGATCCTSFVPVAEVISASKLTIELLAQLALACDRCEYILEDVDDDDGPDCCAHGGDDALHGGAPFCPLPKTECADSCAGATQAISLL